jgi:hypothetical protein
MDLPVQPIAAGIKNPKLLTLFGQSKVGKTTMLSSLPNCLIIDTEKGTDYIQALKVQANNLSDLAAILAAITSAEHKYDYIALDTIDNIVAWVEQAVCTKEGVSQIGDIAYGGGYGQTRAKVMDIIFAFKRVCKHVILVAHRKKAQSEENIEFSVNSLDLSGKLKNIICADSDAIGYVFREEEKEEENGKKTGGRLMISFKTEDRIEAGARPEHLRGKIMPFEWSEIYID